MAQAAPGYTSDWIDPSKIGPPHWLHSEDAFQQMLARAGSGKLAADDLYAWLRSRDWLSVELRVNADGRKTCRRLTADFYRDIAWLEAVPDADAADHLEIHYPDRVDPSFLSGWHTSFWVRAAEFARELERLYPAILYPTTAALPPAPSKEPASTSVSKKKSATSATNEIPKFVCKYIKDNPTTASQSGVRQAWKDAGHGAHRRKELDAEWKEQAKAKELLRKRGQYGQIAKK
jgi:hypothetical protein